MKRMCRWAISGCVAIVMLLPVLVWAAAPTQVNYQGQLKAGGSLFTGTAQMKFAIVDGTTSLWSNDSTSVGGGAPTGSVNVPVANGLFTVALGAAPMKPLSAAVFAGAISPMLRVWVNTGSGFEPLTDQAITSAPFALDGASGGDGLWSVSGGDIYRATGNVGIGTSTPADRLHIVGDDPDLSLDMNAASTTATRIELLYSVGGSPQARVYFDRADSLLHLINNAALGKGVRIDDLLEVAVSGGSWGSPRVLINNTGTGDQAALGLRQAGVYDWEFGCIHSDGTLRVRDVQNGLTKMIIYPGPAGAVSVPVLQITGGDVAERFPVSESVEPGTVLAIDAQHPGRMAVCRQPLSRNVAGVVSGAGELHAGVVLAGAPGEDGGVPVALSGRVWVKADATDRPIRVGDLLVSSALPGHAAAAKNPSKAAGRILGKAMSGLEAGTGFVLVLVSLQ